jgi:hypothetical protein
MIGFVTFENVWYVSYDTQSAGIVLTCKIKCKISLQETSKFENICGEHTRARFPRARNCNVYLTGWMLVSEELSGDDRDRVFLIVDVGDVKVSVDVVGKVLVAHLGIMRRVSGDRRKRRNEVAYAREAVQDRFEVYTR